MIQDIAPHTWDITYKNIQPDPDSRVLFLAGTASCAADIGHAC